MLQLTLIIPLLLLTLTGCVTEKAQEPKSAISMPAYKNVTGTYENHELRR